MHLKSIYKIEISWSLAIPTIGWRTHFYANVCVNSASVGPRSFDNESALPCKFNINNYNGKKDLNLKKYVNVCIFHGFYNINIMVYSHEFDLPKDIITL